jgi:hypothetical protein
VAATYASTAFADSNIASGSIDAESQQQKIAN